VPRKLDTSHTNLSSPTWSADCRWLFAHDGNGRLYRFQATGGRAERVTDRPSSYSLVLGDRLFFNVMEPGGVTVWSKPVGGGPEAPVENLPRLRYDDAWVVSAAGIYYTDASSRPIKLQFYDFNTKTTRTLMTLKQTPIPGGAGLAVSPDERAVLYCQADEEQSEIMVTRDP